MKSQKMKYNWRKEVIKKKKSHLDCQLLPIKRCSKDHHIKKKFKNAKRKKKRDKERRFLREG